MAELQVESIDWHLVTHGQNSHGGEVAGRVDDIGIGRHARQTEGGSWKIGSDSVFTRSDGRLQSLTSAPLPEKGPRPCCRLPRIFWPNRWINRVTTWCDKEKKISTIIWAHSSQSKVNELSDLGVLSFDACEGSLGQLHQLCVSHRVDSGGSWLLG